MSSPQSRMIWRNDGAAAQTIRPRDLFFAAVGTMAFSCALGVSLFLIAGLFSYGSFTYLLFSRFGALFALSPMLSWFGLIFGSAFFALVAFRGYEGWLSTTFYGMAGSALLYLPFLGLKLHPVVVILFGGASAFIFWIFVKVICKNGLVPPQTPKIPS
ncbi:MAG: hypothetical protein ABJJ53_01545 [Sulfitobacter sp.]